MESIALLPASSRRLDGKVALITGAASGIGECTAKLFCQHGAKVVIADVQDDKGHSVCEAIRGAIGADVAMYVHCDVTSEPDVCSAVDAAVSAYGKLDIMFNNAGISGAMVPRIVDTSREEFERVLGINLTGAFLGTKHAARVMVAGGSIIITASIGSLLGGMLPYPYTCSKHALLGLMKSAAVELGARGIRVNCVAPFMVATPLMLEGLRVDSAEKAEAIARGAAVLKGVTLKVEDVAEAALYLGSDDSKYVNGHNLVLDGGFSVTNKAKP